MSIAINHLTDIQKHQLRHCRPDVFGFPVCQRCGGQVLAGECLQCGAEHDKQGNWIEPVLVFGINTKEDGRPPTKVSKFK